MAGETRGEAAGGKVRSGRGRLVAAAVVLAVAACLVVAAIVSGDGAQGTMQETSWPEEGAAASLPVPSWAEEGASGAITLEGDPSRATEESFYTTLAADSDDFEGYVRDCAEAGFALEASEEEGRYTARDAEGWQLDLCFYDQGSSNYAVSCMTVSLYAPEAGE